MDVFEALKTRRAVKKFDPPHKMSTDEIKTLLEHVILSPTSYNQQNWRFIFTTEQEIKNKISIAAKDQPQPKDGSLVIVLCADLDAWNKDPTRYWMHHPPERRELVKKSLEVKYSNNPQNIRDEAIRSCSIAAQSIMLAAKHMNLDSCPMIGFDYEKLAEIIKLPENHIIALMVVIGKRIGEPMSRGGQLPLDEVAFENSF